MITAAMAEILEQVRDASRHERFVCLLVEYEPALRRLAGAYLQRGADREDLMQEIALALWEALPRFRGESSERTWLYRIAHNVAVTAAARGLRREKREAAMPEEFERPSRVADAERELLIAEQRRWLICAVRDLCPVDRQVALLHLEGLTHTEIEGVTGLSQSAIATRLSRIRARLREEHHAREAGQR